MSTAATHSFSERVDLHDIFTNGKQLSLDRRVRGFNAFLQDLQRKEELLYMRCIESAADREVKISDRGSGQLKKMLMFGSNNYLGLANHPQVRERAERAIREFGVGIGGPPLLNGYTRLHRELEERLAALKGSEDALIFSSGYNANVGLVTGLTQAGDLILYDALSHASFCDGVRLAGLDATKFAHNDVTELRHLLNSRTAQRTQDIFVGVEGVYSMDGDLAPLDALVPLCKSVGAMLVVDDAHGTGVMGGSGRGTAEHFGVDKEVAVTMGTFSKVFSVTGGFVAASKPLVNYLRYFARAYMFSASLPPVVIATVLAGLDIIENEPELRTRLRDNVRYAAKQLRNLDLDVPPQAAILPLAVPPRMNIRKAASEFHRRGIFVNSVEYPAVPLSQQRFRISMMATHTKKDIDCLITAIEEIWTDFKNGKLRTKPTIQAKAA